MIIPEVTAKHNIVLFCSGEQNKVFDHKGNEVDSEPYDELMKLVRITGIEAIIYCAKIKNELNVITMYYPTGGCFFTEEFVRKYTTGMKLKFVEPSMSGAQAYFKEVN